LRGGEASFNPVGEAEQVFDPADDFLLFGERPKEECPEKHFYFRESARLKI
jgi:hypothetical protein